jgi:hypothetical protein
VAAKKSVVIEDMEHCFVCGSSKVQVHHIFFGTANRRISDKYGYVAPLCAAHHTGDAGVHFNKDFDLYLKKLAQAHFESQIGTREDFRKVFGKSWL